MAPMDPLSPSHNYRVELFIKCREQRFPCLYSLKNRHFFPMSDDITIPDTIKAPDQLIEKVNELISCIPREILPSLSQVTKQNPITQALIKDRIACDLRWDILKKRFKQLTFIFVDQSEFPSNTHLKSAHIYYKYRREHQSEINPVATTIINGIPRTYDYTEWSWDSISNFIDYTKSYAIYNELCTHIKEKQIKTLPFHLGNELDHLAYFKAHLLISIRQRYPSLEIKYKHPKKHIRAFGGDFDTMHDLLKLLREAEHSFMASKWEPTQLLLEKNASRAPKEVPPILKNINIKDLVTLFNTIHFEQDPTADGKPKPVADFQKSLHSFVNSVLSDSPHSGISYNQEERESYYEDLKGYLTHIIKYLHNDASEDKNRSGSEQAEARAWRERYVMELAEASFFCGGRWMGAAINVWNTIIGALPSSDNVEEKLLEWIDNFKSAIVKKMVSGNNNQSAHEFILYCARLRAQGVYIPGAGGALYNDVYADHGRRGKYSTDKEILEAFMAEFTCEKILSLILENGEREINESKGKKLGPFLDILRATIEIPSNKYETVLSDFATQVQMLEQDPELKAEALIEEFTFGLNVLHSEKMGAIEEIKIPEGNTPTKRNQRELLRDIYLKMRQSLQYEHDKYQRAKLPKHGNFMDKITLRHERNVASLKERQTADDQWKNAITQWKQDRYDHLQQKKVCQINAIKDGLLEEQGLGTWNEDGVLVALNAQAVLAILKHLRYIRPLTPD